VVRMTMPYSSDPPDEQSRQPVQAFIAFGANLGDCRAVFTAARQRLRDCGVEVVGSSGLYITQAVGGPVAQPDYLNAVVEVVTDLSATALLALCLELEQEAGRQRLQHWGPRCLDLDLLLFGNLVCETEHLIVPHPRLHQRRFVLEPLCSLAGEQLHPRLHVSFNDLLQRLLSDSAQSQVKLAELIW